MNNTVLARTIANRLKKEDYLKLPKKMQGWGLSTVLQNMVAEEIDKILTDELVKKRIPVRQEQLIF